MNWELFISSPTADRVAAALLHSLWQSTLLALAAAIVCRLGRRRAVTLHYLVYTTALAACVAALPATYWALGSASARVGVSSVAVPREAATLATSQPEHRQVEGPPSEPMIEPPLRSTFGTPPAATANGGMARSFDAAWQRAIPWLLAIYAVGVIAMLLRLTFGVAGAERLRRAADPIGEGPAARALQLARRRWPLKRAPIVAYSEQVVVPALVGLIKPTILLPASAAAGLTPQELEFVLAHELAHAMRRDLWVTLSQRIVEAVLFFNPAVWYLSRRVSTLREFCCDEAACGEGVAQSAAVRVDYATALLRMAELARPALSGEPRVLALAAAGRSPSEFRRRIARLLGEPVREPLRASRGGLAAALAAVALATGVVWADGSEKPGGSATPQAVTGVNEREESPAELTEEEKQQLLSGGPINSVADAIVVLTEGPEREPTDGWARAIKYLADHKEEALPAVVAALDAEERDHPISKLAFALRAMGDRRGVPVLIRTLPKTLLPGRSDFGLLLDGQGSDHDELLQFMTANDLDKGDDGESFGYGRAFREVAMTLQKLTGQDFGELELNFISLAETPKQFVLQQRLFDRVARRWADWWEANWRTMTADEAFASVNLPLSAIARVPHDGHNELPSGADARLGGGPSGWVIASPQEDPLKRCFLDLDTKRQSGWPDSLPQIEEIGVDSPELLAWAEAEGFDLMGFTHTPPGEIEPLYCLKPLGMKAWKITPSELRALKKRTPGRRAYPLTQPVDVMIPRREILPPFDHAVDGDSFLYLTSDGTAGVVRMTAQVPKKNLIGGAYSKDDDFMPTGFYPGAKVSFSVLK